MKKYIIILALLIVSFANAQTTTFYPCDKAGTTYTIGATVINTYSVSTTAQTLTLYFARNDADYTAALSMSSSYKSALNFTTSSVSTLSYLNYNNIVGTPYWGFSNGYYRVELKVAIPANFRGIFVQNGMKVCIGVESTSKVQNIYSNVNNEGLTTLAITTYNSTNFNTSNLITYSVSLVSSYAGKPAEFRASPLIDIQQSTFVSSITLGAAGTTTIASFTVKSYNNATTTTYTCRYIVAATPPVTLSNNCTLTNLTTSVGTLTPTFATTQTTYTITLPYSTTLPTTLTTANFSYSLPSGATISSSTTAILTATNSVSTLTFVVRAEDNVTTKTYKIIYRLAPANSNNNLATLVCPQGGTLTPVFSPSTINYTVTLPFGTAMNNDLLIATTESNLATITINYITGNQKRVQVKAQNNATKLYSVTYDNAPDPFLNVNENSFNEVVIYPNPTKDKLFINSEKPIKNVVIYNVDGKVVVKQNTQEVDIKYLPAGVYYIEVNQNNNKTKIIKE